MMFLAGKLFLAASSKTMQVLWPLNQILIKSRKVNICLIDDDQIFQFTVRKMIEWINIEYKFCFFSNGAEAIQYFQQHSSTTEALPDVIFLDINMPVMDGWEFLRAFGAIKDRMIKPVTIYMMSSSVDETDIHKAKEFPMVNKYINKPVSRERFIELLTSLAKPEKLPQV
jgi:CheY-like chemotaxis protein